MNRANVPIPRQKILRPRYQKRAGRLRRAKGTSSFTLVELLVVMAILGILIAVSVSSFTSVMASANLTNGGQLIVGQIALARQEAVTLNEQVQVCFYQLPRGATTNWCAIQVWGIQQTDSGATTNAVTRLALLPDGVMISADNVHSSLLTAEPGMPGTTTLANYGSVSFADFYFRPNGNPDYNINTGNNVLTVQTVSGGATPKNYFTLQVNPIGGKISVFRP